MKVKGIFLLVILCFLSCQWGVARQELSEKNEKKIQALIRQVLIWADTKNPNRIAIWSALISKDYVYVGFDFEKHETNLDILRKTDFFAEEFIENYNQIVLTIDRKLKSGELEWFVGELPPFGQDACPWCLCQDVPYDYPCPWDNVEVTITNLDNYSVEAVWKWGLLDLNSPWNRSPYRFRAVKEDGKWKISYLQGFDFEEMTRIWE